MHPKFQPITKLLWESLLAIPKTNPTIKLATHLCPDINQCRGSLLPLGCKSVPRFYGPKLV